MKLRVLTEFPIFSSIRKESSIPTGDIQDLPVVRDEVSSTSEGHSAETVLYGPKLPPSRSPLTSHEGSRAAIRVPGCRSRLYRDPQSMMAACPSSIF